MRERTTSGWLLSLGTDSWLNPRSRYFSSKNNGEYGSIFSSDKEGMYWNETDGSVSTMVVESEEGLVSWEKVACSFSWRGTSCKRGASVLRCSSDKEGMYWNETDGSVANMVVESE